MLQLLTTVWGEKHIELFKKTALKSLGWVKNKEALARQNAKWNIFTDDADVADLKGFCRKTIPEIKFNVMPTSDLRRYIDSVQAASIWQMEKAIESKDRVLLAPPDTIFGDGTVESLVSAGLEEGSVVVVPHPRVLPEIVDKLQNYEEGKQRLVDLAFENLHDSWVHAERGHINQSSYVGGVEWWRVGSTIQGTHRLPSPYLIHFQQEDLDYFKTATSMGHWDHMWPGDILIPRARQRYIASSEAAFIVEITESDKNVPPIIENQPKTGFWRDHLHNRINSQILFTF